MLIYHSFLQALNEGLGEGIFYRGRVLLTLCMDIYSSPSTLTADTGSAALGKVPENWNFSLISAPLTSPYHLMTSLVPS